MVGTDSSGKYDIAFEMGWKIQKLGSTTPFANFFILKKKKKIEKILSVTEVQLYTPKMLRILVLSQAHVK